MASLRVLTPSGIDQFARFIRDRAHDPTATPPKSLLTAEGESEPFLPPAIIADRLFHRRLEAAEYLTGQLASAPQSAIDGNQGLWSWLGLFYFDQLCPEGKRAGEAYRYILTTGGGIQEMYHAYRHLLASPYLIFRANAEQPPIALLCGAVSVHGEVAEQLASSIDLITNPIILAVANQLYFDSTANGPRRGAGGRGPGSPRRFVAIIKQLDLTYDLHRLSSAGLLALLPQEFDRFR